MKLSDLLQFDNIIVQCQDNPDADALASGFGVYEYLRMNGKRSGRRENRNPTVRRRGNHISGSFICKY